MRSTGTPLDVETTWFKSSYSNGSGGECVECGVGGIGPVLIRDSKQDCGPRLSFTRASWATFLRSTL
ncbi:DUF397 domain-containing protein [Streptomyces sp. SID5785]|nr:DUF397 domain-containing protein [Streptomyces sp. SID5785]